MVYPERPARTKVMQWLNRARKQVIGVGGIKSGEFSAAVDELVEAGLLYPSIVGERGVSARGPQARLGTLTRFCESAYERGTASLILADLDDATYSYGYRSPHSLSEHLEQHARLALIADTFGQFIDTDLPPDIWQWLTEPRARPYLERLPVQHRDKACRFGMSWLIHYLDPIETFAKTCAEINPSPTHTTLLARARVFQGQFNTAVDLINDLDTDASLDKRTQVECQAIRAMVATFEGKDQQAFDAIKATIDIERSGTRKRIVYPDTLCFTLALPSLVRLGAPDARALFKSLLEARKKLRMESDLDLLLRAAECADQPKVNLPPLFLPGAPCVIGALLAIASRWHKNTRYPEDHAGVVYWLEDMTRQAHAGGYAWIVAELQVVLEATVSSTDRLSTDIRTLFGTPSALERQASLGITSLTHLVKAMEPWEHSLRELEQLALASRTPTSRKGGTKPTKTRRLVWQVAGGDFAGDVGVTPLEQSLGKNGSWSAGRRVALKRLLEQTGNLPYLTEQDIKAGATIRKYAAYGWGGGSPSYETDHRTLFRLAGHPLVMDEAGQTLAVVEVPPALLMSEIDGVAQLRIEPAFNGEHYQGDFDAEHRRVTVTHFTAAHRRIAEVVPAGGLKIPGTANARLQNLLSALSADISIHGEVEAVPDSDSLQAGNPEPLLVLEPSGSALRVRFRVEPLAASGTFFDVGEGGSVVYVQGPTGSVSVQRDLTMERSRMNGIVDRSAVLSAHFDGRPHLNLDNAIDALELLDEVQDAGIRCIWPGDIPFRIKARVDVGQVTLNVKSGKDWFAASGSVSTGDEADPITLARLIQLMQGQPNSRFVELGKGEFLSLSRTLKQQLDTLQAFSQHTPKDAAEHRVHPMALLALDPLIESATLTADKAWLQRRKRIGRAITEEPTIPPALQAELRTYQQEGFAWLARLGQIGAGACLADDMGLGKTVQALAVLLARASGGPALVVAPTSVVGNWMQEAQRFAPSLNMLAYGDATLQREQMLHEVADFDVVVISYGLLVNDIEHLEKVHWHTAILDEAQAIKNAATRRARCARSLRADFRIVTTGTPVQNNLMDLHSLFGFLNPRLLGSESIFRQRFALPITRDDDTRAREQLQLLVSPFLLRRHKRDVLKELPARTEIRLDVTLSKEEALLYEAIRQEALDALSMAKDKKDDNKQKFVILSYLTRLRRLCCNPTLVSPDWSGPMSKLDVFNETLTELIAGGHKALVFSQFVDHLKIVEKALQERAIDYQYIDGSTKGSQRTARVNAFQAGVGDVFLISLTAGGTGLNLTAADYVVHLDPWWNPAVEDQASDRAHRLGQLRPVTIVRMVTSDTIEEQIQVLHGSKRDLADSVLAGAESASLDAEMMMRLLQGDSMDSSTSSPST